MLNFNISLSRYACVHNGGIHLITLKFLEEMHQFLKSDENELPTLSPSVFQHLMTWSFGSSSATKKSVGLCFTRTQPQKLICCLTDDKVKFQKLHYKFFKCHLQFFIYLRIDHCVLDATRI